MRQSVVTAKVVSATSPSWNTKMKDFDQGDVFDCSRRIDLVKRRDNRHVTPHDLSENEQHILYNSKEAKVRFDISTISTRRRFMVILSIAIGWVISIILINTSCCTIAVKQHDETLEDRDGHQREEVLPSVTSSTAVRSPLSKVGNPNGKPYDGPPRPCHHFQFNCCSTQSPPTDRLVTIRGERHHGTNWIRRIINVNTDACKVKFFLDPLHKTDADGLYGWKHALIRSQDYIPPNHVLLVVTRDVFPWMLSMYNLPYALKDHLFKPPNTPETKGLTRLQRKRTLSEFIRQPWSDKCQFASFYKGKNCPADIANNVIQLRTNKYKNWLSPIKGVSSSSALVGVRQPSHSTRSHIKYESVMELGQEATVGAFLRQHNLTWYNETEFEVVNTVVTRAGRRSHGVLSTDHEKVLRHYTIEDLKFILSELDLDFEKNVLNYSYAHVEEYIRRNESAAITLTATAHS